MKQYKLSGLSLLSVLTMIISFSSFAVYAASPKDTSSDKKMTEVEARALCGQFDKQIKDADSFEKLTEIEANIYDFRRKVEALNLKKVCLFEKLRGRIEARKLYFKLPYAVSRLLDTCFGNKFSEPDFDLMRGWNAEPIDAYNDLERIVERLDNNNPIVHNIKELLGLGEDRSKFEESEGYKVNLLRQICACAAPSYLEFWLQERRKYPPDIDNNELQEWKFAHENAVKECKKYEIDKEDIEFFKKAAERIKDEDKEISGDELENQIVVSEDEKESDDVSKEEVEEVKETAKEQDVSKVENKEEKPVEYEETGSFLGFIVCKGNIVVYHSADTISDRLFSTVKKALLDKDMCEVLPEEVRKIYVFLDDKSFRSWKKNYYNHDFLVVKLNELREEKAYTSDEIRDYLYELWDLEEEYDDY